MAVRVTAGRKAAGGGDESAARVDASCEQPVKPRRFLTSHQPGAIRAGNEAGKCGRIPGKRVLWRHGMDMKKDLLAYLAGLCQAASAALMASAVIMPEARVESMLGCAASAVMGGIFIVLRHKGD